MASGSSDHTEQPQRNVATPKCLADLFRVPLSNPATTAGQADDPYADVLKCGRFNKRPSDLFLKIYGDVLKAPPQSNLINESGIQWMAGMAIVRASIISVIPDIMRYYASLIVSTKRRLFLATNYWENSHSAAIMSQALSELSSRVAREGRPKVDVKIMYDRGTPSQLFKNHAKVKDKKWGIVGLPKKEDVPGLDIEVVNYHRPILGTFHAKFLIIDDDHAVLNSNNIQDRANVEMMVHFERDHNTGGGESLVKGMWEIANTSWGSALEFKNNGNSENQQVDGLAEANIKERRLSTDSYSTSSADSNESNTSPDSSRVEAQNASQITSSDPTASRTIPPYDEPPWSSALNDSIGTDVQGICAHLNGSTKSNNAQPSLSEAEHVGKYMPLFVHEEGGKDEACYAYVNRAPRGTPGHENPMKTPQGSAFLSGFKYATKSVFIQTPTFNATPVVEAALEACRRGIEVTIWADVGFNDLGEQIPFQGGTNESVVTNMYKQLSSEGNAREENLKVHWYVGKDQNYPIDASERKRNCHVKYMCIDGQVVIFGNGNQDTQSWFHSQEVNIMVDSAVLSREWHEALHSVQNTAIYGKVDKDGIWRHPDGRVLESTANKPLNPGTLGKLKGVVGAVNRLRGTGGF